MVDGVWTTLLPVSLEVHPCRPVGGVIQTEPCSVFVGPFLRIPFVRTLDMAKDVNEVLAFRQDLQRPMGQRSEPASRHGE